MIIFVYHNSLMHEVIIINQPERGSPIKLEKTEKNLLLRIEKR